MSLDPTYADLALDRSVSDVDPLVADLIEREHARQRDKLILIPSESLTPKPVRDALASPFTSIYAEGYAAAAMIRDQEAALADIDRQLARTRRFGDRRYYQGNEFSNLVEALAQRRCADLFANDRVAADRLWVNVQPLSGAAANNAVEEALLDPEDTIMGLALAHGGHLSHGASVNRSGRRFKSISYRIPGPDAQLDYDDIAARAKAARPRLIIAGYTSYPWAPDWERFRAIADDVGALLMADISHPAGLVVAGAYPSPVGIADVVTFTTHKTLFGPRGAVILSHRRDLMRAIDRSVFPGEQGGPHLNKIAAMAVMFKMAATEAFQRTQHQIIANARALVDALDAEGVGVAYGGTDTHLFVVNLRRVGAQGDLRGEPAVRMLEALGIVANRNSVPGDRGFAAPTGIRMGTPWLTQRGYGADDMKTLAGILARAFRAMHGVTYTGRRTPRYRGRMGYDAMQSLRAEVLDFARRGHAEGPPPADPPASTSGLLLVRGARVFSFLDEVANRRVRDLEPGQSRHVALAGPPGSDAVNAIVSRPAEAAETSALIAADPDRANALADWLQAASDGYVIVDPDEPSRKLSGPVTVTAHQGDSPALTDAAPPDDASRPWFVGRRPVAATSDGPQPFEWREPESEQLHHTPLHAFHAEHAKKLIPFAGWDMPVWYTSIADEHQAVRKSAGLFDVGHMGVFAVSGPNAAEFLDLVVTGSASRLRVGRAAYTYLLDANGDCLDDLIIYRLARDRFMAVVNAANAPKDWAWLTGVNDGVHQVVSGDGAARLPVRADLLDLKSPAAGDSARLDLAFQGPKSRQVLQRIVATDDERRALDAMRMNHVRAFTLAGADVEISHTGYTGEATGFEIFVHPEAARTVWDAILEAGADDGVVPVGLGARDSTRTEAGFPLYGHELAGPLDLTPGDAGFGRFVKAHKPFFVGRDPYVRREAGRKASIVRFSIADERVPMARQGDPVTDPRGAWIGTVTSATRASSGRQIGMAHVGTRHTRRRTELRIFAGVSARRAGRPQSPADLGPGGRYALPAAATVITRFRG
ncbi:MAG: glycine cleavage system aminomethyltransferase GcvT [Chloroflexi bacterium]|nr:glycine cleavage system aminomethyltransferase GcvT [Chloroflexota bacterium]